MNKNLAIHYFLVAAGLALVIAASYLLIKNKENMPSKLIVAFAGMFVIFTQYLIIRIKRKGK